MAATTTESGKIVEVTAIDADWAYTTASGSSSAGIAIDSITFVPGNADDVIVIKEGSDAGPAIMRGKADTGDPLTVYLDGKFYKPVIDFSACTLNSGHAVIFRMA